MKKSIFDFIEKYFDIKKILILAFILRLFAVLFAQGYGYHDDHFLIIEASQSWVDGTDYNNWLPWNQANPKPEGHSFFYVGLHYCVFSIIDAVSNLQPTTKMYIIRLLNALFSLLTVFFSYKIAEKISDKRNAKIVGLIIAMLWILPWLSVRNLVEMFCIPFLLYATYLIYNEEEKQRNYIFLLAGFIAGFAFSARFQTGIYILGIGLVLLFQQKFIKTFLFGIGTMLSIALIQGGIDMIIWKRPFAELTEYVLYNIANKDAYVTNSWYSYILVLTGLLLLPMGILYWFGIYKSISKKSLLVFVPTLLFLIFHSIYPNKQERFIYTLIPSFIILGQTGLYFRYNEGTEKRKKRLQINFLIFIIINTLFLPIAISYYGKKARIEAMESISEDKNAKVILTEYTNSAGNVMLPSFYSKKWLTFYNFSSEKATYTDTAMIEKKSGYVFEIKNPIYLDSIHPDYVYFISKTNIKNRLIEMEKRYIKLEYHGIYYPGYVDHLLHVINPINKNEPIVVYKVRK